MGSLHAQMVPPLWVCCEGITDAAYRQILYCRFHQVVMESKTEIPCITSFWQRIDALLVLMNYMESITGDSEPLVMRFVASVVQIDSECLEHSLQIVKDKFCVH